MSSLKQNSSANSRRHPAKRPSLEKKKKRREKSPTFEQLLGGSREKTRIDLKRLIQLYNGGTWVYTRDEKTTRKLIDNPAVSLSEYSQPNPLVPIYVKLKERRDSRVDRMIVYQSLPHRVTACETRVHNKAE